MSERDDLTEQAYHVPTVSISGYPDVGEIKVEYVALHGHTSKAYIDAKTGRGVDKYHDSDLLLRWDDESNLWHEVEQ